MKAQDWIGEVAAELWLTYSKGAVDHMVSVIRRRCPFKDGVLYQGVINPPEQTRRIYACGCVGLVGSPWSERITRCDRHASPLENTESFSADSVTLIPPAASAAPQPSSAVDHPAHYGGADDPYEAIKVIEAWGLGFCLGNTVKYICRAEEKDDTIVDLKKARWYLDRRIAELEAIDREIETGDILDVSRIGRHAD